MKPRTRKWLAAGLLLAVALAFLWERVPLPDARARIQKVPQAGFGFASRDLPLSEAEREIFGPATVTKRLYQLARERFTLVIVDGSKNRHAVHDPTYCFRGAGWRIERREEVPVPGGVMARVHLRKAEQRQEAVYWISDGAVRHASAARCWAQTGLRRLTLGMSGAEPVLVLVQPLEGSPAGDLARLPERFPDLFVF